MGHAVRLCTNSRGGHIICRVRLVTLRKPHSSVSELHFLLARKRSHRQPPSPTNLATSLLLLPFQALRSVA